MSCAGLGRKMVCLSADGRLTLRLPCQPQAGFFNRYVTLVPGVPPGTKVPSYTKFW